MITTELLDAVFDSPEGDPGHIAELHYYLSPQDKRRFETACELLDGEYMNRYAIAATQWASVAEDDNVWKLRGIRLTQKIGSWLIDTIYADHLGYWFAQRGAKILSTKEFEVDCGDTIPEHLRKWLEYHPIQVNRVIEAIETRWVPFNVTIERNGAVLTEKRIGPPNIPPKEWQFAQGETFLSAELIDAPHR